MTVFCAPRARALRRKQNATRIDPCRLECQSHHWDRSHSHASRDLLRSKIRKQQLQQLWQRATIVEADVTSFGQPRGRPASVCWCRAITLLPAATAFGVRSAGRVHLGCRAWDRRSIWDGWCEGLRPGSVRGDGVLGSGTLSDVVQQIHAVVRTCCAAIYVDRGHPHSSATGCRYLWTYH